MNPNQTNTITVAPNADFHLFISAGASVWVWIAGAFFLLFLLRLWLCHSDQKRAKHPPEKEAGK